MPRGTEESFHIRSKNIYETNLIKCEDERYEYDLFLKKVEKTRKLICGAI